MKKTIESKYLVTIRTSKRIPNQKKEFLRVIRDTLGARIGNYGFLSGKSIECEIIVEEVKDDRRQKSIHNVKKQGTA